MSEEQQQAEAGVVEQAAAKAPWSMLIFGQPGLGKSTLAAHAPTPYFIDLENGLRRVALDPRQKTKTVIRDWPQLEPILRWAATEACPFQTLVIDTSSKLEELLVRRILAQTGSKSLADKAFAYGKDGVFLEAAWVDVMGHVDAIVASGRNVLFTGHERIEKFEDPTSENYDRYVPRMHKKSSSVLVSGVDAVLFAAYERVLVAKDGSDKKRATTSRRRLLYCNDGASYVAKNRFGLEDVVEMDASLFDKIV